MAPPKGTRIGGRQKGTPNKTTAEIKAAIEGAFVHLGAQKNFNEWAQKNQDVFYTQLMPKVLPLQVRHSGEDGGPVVLEVVMFNK